MESYPAQCRAGTITYVDDAQVQPAQDPVILEKLAANDIVQSPLTISGKALGSWFFEASFPVRLLDGNGALLVTSYAQAQGEWMTADYASFSSSISFKVPATENGFIEFAKDNPSGLPENDAMVRIPIRFK
jgi:hypothetical protein